MSEEEKEIVEQWSKKTMEEFQKVYDAMEFFHHDQEFKKWKIALNEAFGTNWKLKNIKRKEK